MNAPASATPGSATPASETPANATATAPDRARAALRSAARAPRTLRTRLTVAVSIIATVSIAATLAAIAYGLPRLLENGLNDEQRGRIDRIERGLEENGQIPDSEDFAQVILPSGLMLTRTRATGNVRILRTDEVRLAFNGQTVTVPREFDWLDGTSRLFARSANIDGAADGEDQAVVIVVGSPLDQIERTRRLLLAALLAGGLALSMLTTAGAWLLAGAALRPVQRMTDEAATIANLTEAGTISGLSRRLEIPPGKDEIAYLGLTFNDLLDRVEESVQRERSFVDDASHELRTPLSILRGELELAAAHPGDSTEQQQLVHRLAREVDRLAHLADDLLVLARAHGGASADSARLDLLSIATRVAGRMPQANPPIRIDVNGDVAPVLWRSDHAERVLTNLMSNALRFARYRVDVQVTVLAHAVRLTVSDDGPGFPADFLPRAFERFAIADKARGKRQSGTGLGLAIVRELTESAGGTVEVSNRPTGGASITVTFPTAETSERKHADALSMLER
jgi:two-component system, OmpR family, sensor kinase